MGFRANRKKQLKVIQLYLYISLCRSLMSNVSTFSVASLMERKQQGGPRQTLMHPCALMTTHIPGRNGGQGRRGWRHDGEGWGQGGQGGRESGEVGDWREGEGWREGTPTIIGSAVRVAMPLCGTLLKSLAELSQRPLSIPKKSLEAFESWVNLLCSFLMLSFKPRIPEYALWIFPWYGKCR